MVIKASSPRGWFVLLCGLSVVTAAPRVFNVPEGASDGGDDVDSLFASFQAAQSGSTHSSKPSAPLYPSKPSPPTQPPQPTYRPSHPSPPQHETSNPYQTLFSHPAFQTQNQPQVQQPHQQHQQTRPGQASPNVLNFATPSQSNFGQTSNPTPGFQQIKTNHGIFSFPSGTVEHQPTHTSQPTYGPQFVTPVPFIQPTVVQPTIAQPTTVQSFEASVGSFCRSYIESSATDQFQCAALSRPECEWDATMVGTNGQHGACACERDFLNCNDPKCYWAADALNPAKGECISTAERFYKLLQDLLLKRGKKDFAFRINYNAAPSYGYGYGPHDNLGYTAGVNYKEEDHYPAHLYGYGPYGPFINRYGGGGYGYGSHGHGGYGGGGHHPHGGYGSGGYGSRGYGGGYGSYGHEDRYGAGGYGYGNDRYGYDRYGSDSYGYGEQGYGSGGYSSSYNRPDRYNDYDDSPSHGGYYGGGYGSGPSRYGSGRYGSGSGPRDPYSSPYSSGGPADRYCTNCKKRGEESYSNSRSGSRRDYDREQDGYRN